MSSVYFYYFAMLVWAVFNVGAVCWSGRSQNVYRLILSMTVFVTNAGYLASAFTSTVSTEALAMKMCYFGGCFVPLFLLLLTSSICRVKISKPFIYILSAFSCITFALTFTIGYSDWFVTGLHNVAVHGMTYLAFGYGPLYIIFYIYILGFTIASLTFVIYALQHQTKASYKTVGLLGLILIGGIAVFFFQKQHRSPVNIVPFYFNFGMGVILFLTGRMNLYDTKSATVRGDSFDEKGIITLDAKGNFCGANSFARSCFPDLDKCLIDRRAPEDVLHGPLEELSEWLAQLGPETDLLPRKFEVGGRIFRFTERSVHRMKWIQGYVIEFFDVTKEDRHVDMIEHYNKDLQNEVKEQTAHISYIKDMMVLGMASMVESRDNSTGGHIRRTSDVVTIFARKLMQSESEKHLGVTEKFLKDVAKAAPMHDLGKIAVDDKVLRKKGKYNAEEYAEMKKHSAEGARIVREILTGVEDPEFVKIAENVAHYHHEKWNGEGYPEGLSGTDVPLEARIMALADVFDALVSKRYYKEAYSYDTAFGIIVDSLGSHFDPYLGKVFLSCRKELEELYDYYLEHGDSAISSADYRRKLEQEMDEEAGKKTVAIKTDKEKEMAG